MELRYFLLRNYTDYVLITNFTRKIKLNKDRRELLTIFLKYLGFRNNKFDIHEINEKVYIIINNATI